MPKHAAQLTWLIAAVPWLASPSHAQPAPLCAPASDSICRTIAQPEFLSAYRSAYSDTSNPADAVDDVRDNFRRVMLGAGQAGPAAVGRQIDAILDDALARAQLRMCGSLATAGNQVASAVASGFIAAAEARGTRLAPATLGAMTGTAVGATRVRGASCLCTARNFSAIRDACAPS
jgi:hypothetical protein